MFIRPFYSRRGGRRPLPNLVAFYRPEHEKPSGVLQGPFKIAFRSDFELKFISRTRSKRYGESSNI